jgi:FkbM family methyltransferase
MAAPLIVPRIARQLIPVGVRIRLRSSPLVRKLAAKFLGGVAHCRFPDSQLQLFFDGYRHIGFGLNISHLEGREKEVVNRIVRKTAPRVVWDIGANIGTWSLFFSSICAESTEIRCFEPDPQNLKFLEMNMKKNNLSNWIIRPLAVSGREGTATFFADPVCGATGTLEHDRNFIRSMYRAQRIEIEATMTTVDAEISSGARPPQFMKIDVEGHELEVLKGAHNTLRFQRPSLIFETTPGNGEISAFFKALDYELFDLNGMRVAEPHFNTIAAPRELALFA